MFRKKLPQQVSNEKTDALTHKIFFVSKKQTDESYTEKKIKVYEFTTYNKPFFPFLKSLINEKKVYTFVKYG